MARTTAGGNIRVLDAKKDGSTSDDTDYTKQPIEKRVAQFIEYTPVAKLYLVLISIIYSITAYSKVKVGMSQSDVVLLVFFLIFIILSLIFLQISTYLYRAFEKEGEISFVFIKQFLKNFFTPIVISLFLFVIISLLFYFSGKVIITIIHSLNFIIR